MRQKRVFSVNFSITETQRARAQMKVTEQYRDDLDPEVKKLLLWNNIGRIQLRISAEGAAPCTG